MICKTKYINDGGVLKKLKWSDGLKCVLYFILLEVLK